MNMVSRRVEGSFERLADLTFAVANPAEAHGDVEHVKEQLLNASFADAVDTGEQCDQCRQGRAEIAPRDTRRQLGPGGLATIDTQTEMLAPFVCEGLDDRNIGDLVTQWLRAVSNEVRELSASMHEIDVVAE